MVWLSKYRCTYTKKKNYDISHISCFYTVLASLQILSLMQLTSSSNATLTLKFHQHYRAVSEQAWGNLNPCYGSHRTSGTTVTRSSRDNAAKPIMQQSSGIAGDQHTSHLPNVLWAHTPTSYLKYAMCASTLCHVKMLVCSSLGQKNWLPLEYNA